MRSAQRFDHDSVDFAIDTAGDHGHGATRVKGALDLLSAPTLEAFLGELRRDGHHTIVLDLTELDYLGAAGLRVLVQADHAFREVGGSLVLTGLSPMAKRVLTITGYHATLTVT